jgi:hypothetical protein
VHGDTDTLPGKALVLFRRHDTPTMPILQAVNELWREIQHNHPGTPNVNIVLQADAKAHGHFAPNSWRGGDTTHELMLSTMSFGEFSNTGAVVKTVSTLLHEAAHAFAHAAGIQDTSRGGRWHNKRFAALATEFGCEVATNPQIGHVTAGITAQAYATYRPQIEKLQSVITAYRAGRESFFGGMFGGSFPTKPRKPYGSQTVTVSCLCGIDYRIPRALFESTTIQCDDCGDAYAVYN